MATRCPSPNPSRPLNLNPRTPDSSGSARKSTNSNTMKASSPSDAPQKNSVSKARAVPSSLRASFEQKENEGDPNCPKIARVRSPGMPCSKGVKSFMAPTISASSKAIAASPRRKVLAESNEAVSSSLTSVSGSHESLAMGEVLSKPQHTLPGAAIFSKASADGAGTEETVPKCEMASGFQEISDCTSSAKLDLEVNNTQPVVVESFSPPPANAPLDADPSVPPYDPETNYLSPRPRFLRYRPNPRIEHYLNKDGGSFGAGDGKRLEDSFYSESCETAAGQTEEVVSSDSQKDSEEWSCSKEVEVTGATDGNTVSEPKLMSNSKGKHIKSRPSMKFKFIPLVLVLVACLSIPLSDSPIISSSSMLKAPALSLFEDLPVRNYLTAAWSLRRWSINSFSYYTAVTSLPKEEEYSLLCLANLTAASAIDEGLEKYEMEQALKKNVEEEGTEGHEMERNFEVEDLEAAQDSVAEYETERMEMEIAEDLRGDCMEFDEEKAELQEDVKDDRCVLEFEVENKFEGDDTKEMEQGGNIQGFEDQKNTEVEFGLPRDLVTEPEKVDGEEGGSDFGSPSKSSHPEVGNEYQMLGGFKLENSSIYGSEHKPLMPLILGVFSAVVVLAASLLFLLAKQKQALSVVTQEKLPPNKAICTPISGSSYSYINAARSPYQNSLVDVQMVGDSGPPELSITLNSSLSYGRQRTKRAKEEEDLSHERRLRRDSTASSSSISYGSFTTYEKLSTKKGSNDEEAMTPVRRSSRIRNQITSP